MIDYCLADETEMIVTWIEPYKYYRHSPIAYVHYDKSEEKLKQYTKAICKYFRDGNTKYTTFRALLRKLQPGTKYCMINEFPLIFSLFFVFVFLKIRL